MKRSIYHPPVSLLPPGFRFPQAYLDFIHQENVPDLTPWFIMCYTSDPGYYDWWLATLKEQFPSRQLVPFAKWDLDDDIACFEPSDNPELPAIHYIHSFTKPGYEERGYCVTFEKWLSVALEEARDYQADAPDYAEEAE